MRYYWYRKSTTGDNYPRWTLKQHDRTLPRCHLILTRNHPETYAAASKDWFESKGPALKSSSKDKVVIDNRLLLFFQFPGRDFCNFLQHFGPSATSFTEEQSHFNRAPLELKKVDKLSDEGLKHKSGDSSVAFTWPSLRILKQMWPACEQTRHIQIGRDLERQPRFLQESGTRTRKCGRDILPRSPGHSRSQPQALEDVHVANQTDQILSNSGGSRCLVSQLVVCSVLSACSRKRIKHPCFLHTIC